MYPLPIDRHLTVSLGLALDSGFRADGNALFIQDAVGVVGFGIVGAVGGLFAVVVGVYHRAGLDLADALTEGGAVVL